MTEEIIIDGVNVAGCGYYYDTFGHCDICGRGTDKSDTFCSYCKDNSDCYYKQLQRLKQENETYKRKNVELQITLNEFNRFNNYRKALEEIREIVMESQPIDEPISQTEFTMREMALQTNKLIRVIAKINEVLGNED